PAEVAVELVLKLDEALVPLGVERDVPEHRADHVRADRVDVRLHHRHGAGGLVARLEDLVGRRVHVAQEDLQRAGYPLDAQEVVPVRRDVDLVNHLVGQRGDLILRQLHRLRLGRLLPLGGHLVELHAELEAQLVELVVRVRPPEVGEQGVTPHRHLLQHFNFCVRRLDEIQSARGKITGSRKRQACVRPNQDNSSLIRRSLVPHEINWSLTHVDPRGYRPSPRLRHSLTHSPPPLKLTIVKIPGISQTPSQVKGLATI
ncbi:hypothetical protein THAOC_14832, partial [Thalassiosira oceanica]